MPIMLLYVTVALTLVLILRRPAQRLFGATPAFTLWLLPPLLALLPWLPNTPSAWLDTMPMQVFPASRAFAAELTSPASSMQWTYMVWAVGVSLSLLRLAWMYGRLRRQTRALPASMRHVLESEQPDLDMRRLRLHPAGPALLWAPRSLLLLPADFLERFDACQRQWVLQHETTHLRRGDAWWSLFAELMFALLWFHPLAWLALPRLRLDQELACDERVLRQSVQDEAAYAHTLLHSTGVSAMPMSIPWLTRPQLKERLSMIQRPRPGALRRRFGFTALAALIVGTAFVAQAATQNDPPGPPAASSGVGIVSQTRPHYPESAIKNREEGTVVLTVLVDSNGQPLRVVSVNAHEVAPDLIQAASDTIMTWRFTPAMSDGKPTEAYARVPISFKLSTPAPTSSTPPPAAAAAPSSRT